MKSALAARNDLTNAQKTAILSLYGWEGGLTDDGNGTIAGLTRTFLDRIHKDAPTSAAQVIDLYLAYMDDSMKTAGGQNAVNSINDPIAGAAFNDTVFYQGRGNGSEIIQIAINSVRTSLGQDKIAEDGQMGPGTLAAYQALLQDPKSRAALLNALADGRMKWSRNYPEKTPAAKKATRGDLIASGSRGPG